MADYRLSRASSDPTPSVNHVGHRSNGRCLDCGIESTPSVDADYPPARLARVKAANVRLHHLPGAAESLALMRELDAMSEPTIERRKANNVNQAIEFLNAAGRRAGDR
jgi:hypothetical protein